MSQNHEALDGPRKKFKQWSDNLYTEWMDLADDRRGNDIAFPNKIDLRIAFSEKSIKAEICGIRYPITKKCLLTAQPHNM